MDTSKTFCLRLPDSLYKRLYVYSRFKGMSVNRYLLMVLQTIDTFAPGTDPVYSDAEIDALYDLYNTGIMRNE